MTMMRAKGAEYLEGPTKRAFDLLGAIGLSLGCAAPAIAAAIAVKLEDGGPAVFHHERLGQEWESFKMPKLRSMIIGPARMEATPLYPEQTRITRVGRHLRRFGLDETPQFLKVIQGTMSLTGPRPVTVYDRERLHNADPYLSNEWDEIYPLMKPGISGTAQLAIKSTAGLSQREYDILRMREDIKFYASDSLDLDLQIMAQTPLVLIKGPKPLPNNDIMKAA